MGERDRDLLRDFDMENERERERLRRLCFRDDAAASLSRLRFREPIFTMISNKKHLKIQLKLFSVRCLLLRKLFTSTNVTQTPHITSTISLVDFIRFFRLTVQLSTAR